MTPYFQRLAKRVEALGPLCVGIDPHGAVLDAWEVSQDVRGLETMARGVVEALVDSVAVFKPQSAFFEAYGSAGIAVLERCLADIHSAGGLVILDVKRGDIGSTMTAYAQAYLGNGPLVADAITVSPYLGFGSLEPAMSLAEKNGRGVYVLARTSNPEGGDIQLGHSTCGQVVAQSIVDAAGDRNRESGLNTVGLVVGGTHESLGIDVSGYQGSILVPGIGAQGGTISGVARLFSGSPALILPSVSREVLYAGANPTSLRQAVAKVLDS